MNHPTAADFFAQPHDDEDDAPAENLAALPDQVVEPLTIGPGMLYQIPPDPMERIATALEAIARLNDSRPERTGAAVKAQTEAPHTWAAKAAEQTEKLHSLNEAYDDLEAKCQALTEVLTGVDAALGKSKAAPALAAKAVIEEWRNPQVAEEEMTDTDRFMAGEILNPSGAAYEPDIKSHVEGHTRTPHETGPDYCRECSGEAMDWVVWPCEAAGGEPQAPLTGPEEGYEPVQPEHDAPVEEWRSYAAAVGLAGPEIAKANRSQIRTALGIAQVPAPEAGA